MTRHSFTAERRRLRPVEDATGIHSSELQINRQVLPGAGTCKQNALLTWFKRRNTRITTPIFGVMCINSDKLFMLRNQLRLRGHKNTLAKPRCTGQVRRGF